MNETRTPTTTRTPAQRTADRDALRRSVPGHWTRLPDANRSDLNALVKAGYLEKQVRTEWDAQAKYTNHGVQGASVKRNRAYYRQAR